MFTVFSVTPVAAKPGIAIQIDGKTFRTTYENQNGSTMVPAAFLRHAGTSVTWDQTYQAVRLSKGSKKISLPSETKEAYHWTGTEWVRKPLATKTVNVSNATYVPLRYSLEQLGMKVSYNAKTSTIYVSTGKPAAISANTFAKSAFSHSKSYSKSDLYWLYQLTEAEAGGESYKGKVAVAASVLNRVGHPNWPSTLKGVIFQTVEIGGVEYYQYSPVLDGRIYEVKPTKDTIRAANEALNGKDPTHGSVVFYNPDKTDNKWVRNRPTSVVIGNHIFAK
jgi:spore germination cell wall hydrolase CwlJ-like protein